MNTEKRETDFLPRADENGNDLDHDISLLCQRCQNIFQGEKEIGAHYPHSQYLRHVQISASEGCHLCKIIWHYECHEEHSPLYRDIVAAPWLEG